MGSQRALVQAACHWCVALCLLLLPGCASKTNTGATTSSSADAGTSPPEVPHLRIFADPVGLGAVVLRALCAEFCAANQCQIDVLAPEIGASSRLTQTLRYLENRSEEVDVYQIDVIWPSILAEHLADLRTDVPADGGGFLHLLLSNNTVGGRLVAIPWYLDFGLLYCRKDLLEKYGFTNPPDTWQELELQATVITDGERAAGRTNFYGYAFAGEPQEGLTCEAMEWIADEGGGLLIDPSGKCDISTPSVAAALDRAAQWVGAIAPRTAPSDDLVKVQDRFLRGDAAFMRNWTHAWGLVNRSESTVAGKVVVSAMPRGKSGRATVLGGWQLAVSRYSRHPEIARKLVVFLTSEAAQRRRAIQAGFFPSRPSLFTDPPTLQSVPHIKYAGESMAAAILRPSKTLAGRYNEVSATVYTTANEVLTRKIPAAQAAEIIYQTVTNAAPK